MAGDPVTPIKDVTSAMEGFGKALTVANASILAGLQELNQLSQSYVLLRFNVGQALNVSEQYYRTLNNLRLVTGLTGQALNTYKDAIRDVATQLGVSQTRLIDFNTELKKSYLFHDQSTAAAMNYITKLKQIGGSLEFTEQIQRAANTVFERFPSLLDKAEKGVISQADAYQYLHIQQRLGVREAMEGATAVEMASKAMNNAATAADIQAGKETTLAQRIKERKELYKETVGLQTGVAGWVLNKKAEAEGRAGTTTPVTSMNTAFITEAAAAIPAMLGTALQAIVLGRTIRGSGNPFRRGGAGVGGALAGAAGVTHVWVDGGQLSGLGGAEDPGAGISSVPGTVGKSFRVGRLGGIARAGQMATMGAGFGPTLLAAMAPLAIAAAAGYAGKLAIENISMPWLKTMSTKDYNAAYTTAGKTGITSEEFKGFDKGMQKTLIDRYGSAEKAIKGYNDALTATVEKNKQAAVAAAELARNQDPQVIRAKIEEARSLRDKDLIGRQAELDYQKEFVGYTPKTKAAYDDVIAQRQKEVATNQDLYNKAEAGSEGQREALDGLRRAESELNRVRNEAAIAAPARELMLLSNQKSRLDSTAQLISAFALGPNAALAMQLAKAGNAAQVAVKEEEKLNAMRSSNRSEEDIQGQETVVNNAKNAALLEKQYTRRNWLEQFVAGTTGIGGVRTTLNPTDIPELSLRGPAYTEGMYAGNTGGRATGPGGTWQSMTGKLGNEFEQRAQADFMVAGIVDGVKEAFNVNKQTPQPVYITGTD